MILRFRILREKNYETCELFLSPRKHVEWNGRVALDKGSRINPKPLVFLFFKRIYFSGSILRVEITELVLTTKSFVYSFLYISHCFDNLNMSVTCKIYGHYSLWGNIALILTNNNNNPRLYKLTHVNTDHPPAVRWKSKNIFNNTILFV